jgi:hypothetical protein
MTLLLVHAAATLFMTGLIWFVQLVHYPLFSAVGGSEAAAYHRAHGRRTSWVVGPPMLVELATAVALVVAPPDGVLRAWSWGGLALLGVVWLSTAVLQVPAHQRLDAGRDPAVERRLVAGNWIRTVAWSARAVAALAMVARAAGA